MPSLPQFRIGQRISFSNSLSTIRYVGPLEGSNGDWLGVEWDDPGRGKHSGNYNGVRYFECKSKHPKAASFVRPTRPSDPALGFLEALHKKYASGDEELLGLGPSSNSTNIIEISGKVVEEVGFEKIRQQLAQLAELRIVLLDGLFLAGLAQQPQSYISAEQREKAIIDITRTCPKILELDLSRNYLEQWGDVASISTALPALKSLKLNGNRFADFSVESESQLSATKGAFSRILNLGLDDTLLSWEEISSLASYFCSLTSISASANFLNRLNASILPETVRSVTLEHNDFCSISAVAPLEKLSNLESLYLRSNNLSTIIDEAKTDPVPVFSASLSHVDISYNSIKTWEFINGLHEVFPGLTGLRVAHNPLYEDPGSAGSPNPAAIGYEEGYMLTLARIGELQTLNFSPITPAERLNAEMYYLSRIAKDMGNVPKEDENLVINQHPRYHELCGIYGPPIVVRKSADAVNPNSLEARLITFSFYLLPDSPIDYSTPNEITHQVPKGFDVYRVKGIVGQLFGLRPLSLKLVWESTELDPQSGDDDSESEDEGQEAHNSSVATEDSHVEKSQWIHREVEIRNGIREIGFWVDGDKARVRVEVLKPAVN
ncbi:MAG: hypothetical protein M1829_001722 [Trizodia sp. TS-e1964]|nr:MAG: hypothetical protein M1829_001722 [Trizodia sp. TS-e1964]